MTGRIFQTAPRKRLVDEVIWQIQQKISLGFFKPGDKLPSEPELMTDFGVGRSTIREAIKVLANAGLLNVKQGEGTFVLDRVGDESLSQRLRRADILEVYEVRRILEIEIAALAALHRTSEDLAAIETHLQQQKQYTSLQQNDEYVESDLAFHAAIAAATHNAVLVDLYRTFAAALRKTLRSELDDPAVAWQTDYHDKVYEAIKARDSQAAKQWTVEYLEQIVNIVKGLSR